ncbi:MAG TPA: hypothetical protein ENH28_02440 [Euryarchaeota archaeon]|nr:hypothetical protein [Euryarchaeota archaeon]
MRRMIAFCAAVFIIVGLHGFQTDAEVGSKNIPEYIENLVFKYSDFSRTITMVIPREDKPGGAERVKKMEEKEDEEYFACKRKGWEVVCSL